MAEIKSTLDIILEKTKHLSLSEEEKEQQLQTDARQKLKGVVQKYLDHALRLETVGQELRRLEKEHNRQLTNLLLEEILERLWEDRMLLELLEAFFDAGGIRSLCEDYEEKLARLAEKRMGELKEALKQKSGISGSAVKPVLQADNRYRTAHEHLRDDFQKKLCQEKQAIAPT